MGNVQSKTSTRQITTELNILLPQLYIQFFQLRNQHNKDEHNSYIDNKF